MKNSRLVLLITLSIITLSYSQYSLEDDIVDCESSGSKCKPLPLSSSTFTSDWNTLNGISCSLISPIDIKWYEGSIKHPFYPVLALNGTFYQILNEQKFTWYKIFSDSDSNDYVDLKIVIDSDLHNKAYTMYHNLTLKYNLKEIRLKVFSEHLFESMKMDLEFQLIHEMEDDSKTKRNYFYSKTMGKKMQKPNDLMAISIMFSASLDKTSDFISNMIQSSNGKYSFREIKSMDFNQFTDQHEPYYFYQGTGTSPLDCSEDMDWFVMRKVNYMSEEQLKGIRMAMISIYPNGNAIKANTYSLKSDFAVEYHSNEETNVLYRNRG